MLFMVQRYENNLKPPNISVNILYYRIYKNMIMQIYEAQQNVWTPYNIYKVRIICLSPYFSCTYPYPEHSR